MNHVTLQTEMESHACSYHPVLVKTAKVKATSVAVEQQPLFGLRTVRHAYNLEIETYVEAGVRRKGATCVHLPYKMQTVTMCFENSRQTRTTRQERTQKLRSKQVCHGS